MQHRIAFVINSAWNAFNFRKGLIKHFISKGHKVYLISPRDASVEKLASWGVEFVEVDIESSGMNPIKDLQYMQALKKVLREHKIDIVLGYTIKPNIYGSFAAGSLKIPMICNVSGLGTVFLWKGWIKLVASQLYNRAFKKSSFVFFQNKDDRALFLKEINIDKNKTGLLPGSGIDLKEFSFAPKSRVKSFTFLMISRLIIEKGVLDYGNAAEQIKSQFPDARFLLLGKYDPEHKRSISPSEYERLCGQVEYMGEVDNVSESITDADAIVLPSYREGTPRTLLEASAIGRPMVATDVPGCKEVVLDGVNGFLCQLKSADDLADKMIRLVHLSNDAFSRMQLAARKHVENSFDEQIVIKLYENKISELLS